MLEGLSLKIKQVPAMEAIKTILASVSNPGLRRANRVQGTLTLRGFQHLEEADQSLGRAMKVRCNVPKRTVLRMVLLTVESADRALMPSSFAVRVGTWLETTH